jgi:nucleoside-triphosphatase THEP1
MLSIRKIKISLALAALGLLFVQNLPVHIVVLLGLLPFTTKRWRELKALKFWLIFIAVSFWPCLLIRSMQTVEISAIACCRGLNFYLLLLLISENVNFSAMQHYLPKLLGPRLAAALILAFNLLPNLSNTIVHNYYLFRLKNFNCSARQAITGFSLALFRQIIGIANSCAENMLLNQKLKTRPLIVIITGEKHAGKTTYATSLVEKFQEKHWPISGILAPSEMQAGRRTTIWVKSIKSGAAKLFASRTAAIPDKIYEYGEFNFSQAGYNFAHQELLDYSPRGIVFLDEFGVLEFAGLGYAQELQELLKTNIAALFVVVRKELVEKFIAAYQLDNYRVIDIHTEAYLDNVAITNFSPREFGTNFGNAN